MSCATNGWTDVDDLKVYAVYYVFLGMELPFGVRDNCIFVNIFSGVDLFNRE